MTQEPRPNTLSEEARPNVLSIGTPVAAGRPAGATSPPRGITAPPTTARRGARSRGNPARRFFLFLILAFFAYARFANLGSDSGGGPFGDQPTTAPAVEEPSAVPNYGFVEFGTSVGSHCVLAHTDEVFPVGTHVFWWAHLAINQRPDQTVAWFLSLDGEAIDKGIGPSDHPTSSWDGICGDKALLDEGAGMYRLEVWDPAMTVLLAAGDFVLDPVSSKIASPAPGAS